MLRDELRALRPQFNSVIAEALEEDLGDRDDEPIDADITTASIVPEALHGRASVTAKESGVICGLEALDIVYERLGRHVEVVDTLRDGEEVEAGRKVATIEGPVRALLVGERTALNLISHLSGIATTVREYVRAAPDVAITDTRKTLPGLRVLQKYAVRVGGGTNHRFALWDGVLIKDNHIVAAGGVGEAVRRARVHNHAVQVECTSMEEVDAAIDAGALSILLDNRSPEELRDLVAHIRGRKDFVSVEASGSVTLDTVAAVAASGVDRISVGALTHSVRALDLSFALEEGSIEQTREA